MTSINDAYKKMIDGGLLAPDPRQKDAVTALEKLSLRMVEKNGGLFRKKQPPARGIYLQGSVGRGKTMVMDLFFKHAPVDKKRRVHFHAFMLEVHDQLHKLRGEMSTDDLLLHVANIISKNTRLLCLDEFQVKDVADAMILGRLFTALFDRGVTIVMTSNVRPDDLYEDGLNRDSFLPFIALLKACMDILTFDGERDYRLQRLAGKKTYFWPHDSDAAQSLEDIFDALADGDEAAPRDISVKGRVIHVPKQARRVAAFTFDQMCCDNKSAVDYLELLKHYDAFVISNVPKLGDADRNAALRFITLVDTLYDHHARLALSAAAPPEQLYAGHDHQKIFTRTVSRLNEMQSRQYIEGSSC